MSQNDVAARAEHAGHFLLPRISFSTSVAMPGLSVGAIWLDHWQFYPGLRPQMPYVGMHWGERAAGEDHLEAVALLRRGSGSGDSSAAQLKRLLSAKTTAQYSPALLGDVKAAQLLSLARRLVDTMESQL